MIWTFGTVNIIQYLGRQKTHKWITWSGCMMLYVHVLSLRYLIRSSSPQNFAVRGSDIGRYCVMHQQGGIYADLDYEAVVIQKKWWVATNWKAFGACSLWFFYYRVLFVCRQHDPKYSKMDRIMKCSVDEIIPVVDCMYSRVPFQVSSLSSTMRDKTYK